MTAGFVGGRSRVCGEGDSEDKGKGTKRNSIDKTLSDTVAARDGTDDVDTENDDQ